MFFIIPASLNQTLYQVWEFCELNHGQLLYLLFVRSFVRSFVCLFVCSFVRLLSFHSRIFTHMETSPLQVKGWKFWPKLGTHGHWALGFFNVPPLIWHGASVYNSHLRGPVTLSPITERLAVELSYLVCRGWDSNKPKPSGCGANALTHCATAAVVYLVKGI